jgi:probable HAF family extracellular repeat protein
MNFTPHFRAAAVAGLVLITQSAAHAATTFGVKDIGPISGNIRAASMNDKSWITGRSSGFPNGTSGAFLTGPNGKNPRPLGDGLIPYAINIHGAVAGAGISHAFASGKQGNEPRDIGALGGGKSTAYAINSHGLVVGYSETTPGYIRAFRYDSNTGTMVGLGNCPVDASNAQAVNDKGVIAGNFFCEETDPIRVFIASPPSYTMVGYGLRGAYNFQVYGISPKGSVIGTFGATDNPMHSFVIRPGKQIEVLAVPPSIPNALAFGINDAGTIVGAFVAPDGEYHAFACSGDCSDAADLNTVAPAPSGAVYMQALSVNASGQILATGLDGHGYLLTPKN